jgi:MFS family permease
MVILGCLIIICAIYSFSCARGFWDIVAADILFGIGGGLSTPPVMALAVVKGNKTKSMGSIMSLLTIGHSLGMMTGSFFAGIIMDYFGLRSVFLLGTTIMIVGGLLFILLTREKEVIPFIK